MPALRALQKYGYGTCWALLLAAGAPIVAAPAAVPVYGYDIVRVYPHDPHAFTEGLFYLNGQIYESTGLNGASSVRKEQLDTGKVLQELKLPARYFGEGIVNWDRELVELTWRAQVGFVYDLATFARLRQFSYVGEGWGLTQNGRWLIMSDGTAQLRYLDPHTLAQVGQLEVTYEGQPLTNLNELEWVRGEIFANIWQTNWIARIDPNSGEVVGLIDLSGILAASEQVPGQTDVLNGIAYDAERDRLFVTGKNWPKLFQIRLHRLPHAAPPAPAASPGAR